MKRISRFLILVSVIMLLAYFLPSFSEAEIYEKVLRFHVLANSDTPEDQALKLKVRDAVLEYSSTFGDIDGIENAEEKYSAELENIKNIAEKVIEENGYEYSVSVGLGYEYYPTRQYEDVSLPAGEYLSLKIMIGESSGQNWWCVLYPPLCISAASAKDKLVEAGFTPEQMLIITDRENTRYKVKFKILEGVKEIWRSIKNWG